MKKTCDCVLGVGIGVSSLPYKTSAKSAWIAALSVKIKERLGDSGK